MNTIRNLIILLVLLSLSLVAISCGDDDDDDDSSGSSDDDDDTGDDDDDNDDDDNDTSAYVVAPVTNNPPPWPHWALEHWVWEDESTQTSAEELVQGYIDNDIPVSAIIIDSPWATGYNTFEFDLGKYPDPQGMIDTLHGQSVRIMLWTTPNINTDSPNYQEALDLGYLVNNGRTVHWWKGDGAFIDYLNPNALDWWHAQMDNVLDMGIDGWKTDGTVLFQLFWGVTETAAGPISWKEYQNLYYRDFFYYTREKLGDDRIITARPCDSYAIPFYGPEFAPHDVNFAAWVGDQDPDWFGLNAALMNMFFSSDANYVNFGSDIGGYRGDDLRDKELFIRWAQLGAMSPVMENGGSGEHRPWMYDQETLDIYRNYTKLHHALIPYLYSQGAQSYAEGIPLWRNLSVQWNYLLGDNILVRAISNPGGTLNVTFPDEGTWIHFWDGTEHGTAGQEEFTYTLEEYPIFVRKGGIIPMDQREGSVFTGTYDGLHPLTVWIYPDPGKSAIFNVYEEGGTGARVAAIYGSDLELRLTATSREYAFKVLNVDEPSAVTSNPAGTLDKAADLAALAAMDAGWTYLAGSSELWIKPGDASEGVIIKAEY